MSKFTIFLASVVVLLALPSYSNDDFIIRSAGNVIRTHQARVLQQNSSYPDGPSTPQDEQLCPICPSDSGGGSSGAIIALAVTVPILAFTAVATALVGGCIGYGIGRIRARRQFAPDPFMTVGPHMLISSAPAIAPGVYGPPIPVPMPPPAASDTIVLSCPPMPPVESLQGPIIYPSVAPHHHHHVPPHHHHLAPVPPLQFPELPTSDRSMHPGLERQFSDLYRPPSMETGTIPPNSPFPPMYAGQAGFPHVEVRNMMP